MNKNKIYMLFLALCLISCSNEIEVTSEGKSDSISFSAGVSSNTYTYTMTSTDSRFKTAFKGGDVIGIFIYSRNEGEVASIDENELYVSNIKLTYQNGNWELERPVYYPGNKKLLDIYAYYPYKDGSDVHSMEYNAHEEMNELLMTSVIGTKKSNSTIMLKFQHMQSLAHVTLTKDNNVPDFDENLNVYFNGVIGGKYNIATQMLAEPLKGIIQMDLASEAGTNKREYIAYIPEQEAPPGILFSFFQMTYNKEILSSKDIDHTEIFVRGMVKQFNIRIKQEIEKNITYGLYDLYPKYGIPVGMVIETYNGGRNGKVISLKNVGKVAWATLEAEGYATGATDINDGITNKMKVQGIENWEENYPAFKACVTYGERWYLPCIGELQWFLTNTYTNGYRLNAINNNLWHHGNNNPELEIETVYIDESYFSSTESWSNPALAIKLYTGGNYDTPHDQKNWPYYIRPFYEF